MKNTAISIQNLKQIIRSEVESQTKLGYSRLLKNTQNDSVITKTVKVDGQHYTVDVRCRVEDEDNRSIRVHGSIYKIKEAKWWQLIQIDKPSATYTDIVYSPKE